ncbi:MAG TPA: hypothetical protein VN886_02300 [Acidimicrobiales bacterium]|nr:hypothetical protein [Acidimicrobiales bacterium]
MNVVLATATSTIIVWSAVLGIIVALGIILGWVTKTGKPARRWLGQRLSRRPAVPRTRVVIEPDTRFCIWSQAAAPNRPPPVMNVTFQMPCTVTNLTPGYDLKITGVEIRGVKGAEHWNAAQVFRPGDLGITETIRADVAERAMLMVVLERDPLPPGRHEARMIVRDNLRKRHLTPKVTFKDGNPGSPDGPSPPKTIATSADLNDLGNRPPSGLPPKPTPRISRQTGSPIDPP